MNGIYPVSRFFPAALVLKTAAGKNFVNKIQILQFFVILILDKNWTFTYSELEEGCIEMSCICKSNAASGKRTEVKQNESDGSEERKSTGPDGT